MTRVETAPAADPMATAAAMLGRPSGKWGGRLATGVALYHLGRQAHQAWKNHRTGAGWVVTLPEGDEAYDAVQGWLLDRLPPAAQRALVATTRPDRPDHADEIPADGPVARRLALAYSGDRSHELTLNGHTVTVTVEQDTNSRRPGTDPENGRSSWLYMPNKVVFTATSVAGRDAVVEFLRGIAATLVATERPPRLVTATRWGSWSHRRREMPPRPLESVVLPDGMLAELLDDMRRFVEAEEVYGRLGLPWHRGYLLHGPPGTGKTSAFRALAGALGLDVYVVSLSDLAADAQLVELLGEIRDQAMLLIEDVDVVHAAVARDDDRPGVTMAGLLNALDGMVTPHGLITALTTNHRDAIDEALLRKGRVNVERELGYLTPEQWERLVHQFTGQRLRLTVHGLGWPQLTPGDVVGVITEHLDDMEAAGRAVVVDLMARFDLKFTPPTPLVTPLGSNHG